MLFIPEELFLEFIYVLAVLALNNHTTAHVSFKIILLKLHHHPNKGKYKIKEKKALLIELKKFFIPFGLLSGLK